MDVGQRRVTTEFESNRRADELLALAYQNLRRAAAANRADRDSVQNGSQTEDLQVVGEEAP
jgi:hypothetical protein